MNAGTKGRSRKERNPDMRSCRACGEEYPIGTYQKYGPDKIRRTCNVCLEKVEAIKQAKSKRKTQREMMMELAEKLEVIAQKDNGDILGSLESKFESKIESLRGEMKDEFRLVKEEMLRVLEMGMEERDRSEKALLEEIKRINPTLVEMVRAELKEWRRLTEQVGLGNNQQSPKRGLRSGESSTVGSGSTTPGGTSKKTAIYATQELSKEWLGRLTDDELHTYIKRIGVAKSTNKDDKEVMELLRINQEHLIGERKRRGLKAK
jgi:hypothetical protein